MKSIKKIAYFVNVDWFFISHRLPLAIEAKKRGYEVIIVASNTGRFKELETYGFRLYDLHIERSGTNLLKEFISIIKILWVLIQIRPDIIHNITLKVSIYCSIAAIFTKKIKVINAISGLGYIYTSDRKTKANKLVNLLMKFAFYKRGYTFIFQNLDDMELFKNQKFNVRNKFILIKGSGVNLKEFHYSPRKNINVLSFILTARMLKDKGINEFISASKLITYKFPDTKFTLVGDIDKENPASYKADELKNELEGTKIEWLGHRNDIPKLLNESNVMVFPSYREGLPKSLIEAAASGLPIITTETVGCKDCVDEGVNGFLVPVGNSKLLAEKMAQLIENPQMIEKMGKASRIKAEKEFSIEMVIEQTFKLYE